MVNTPSDNMFTEKREVFRRRVLDRPFRHSYYIPNGRNKKEELMRKSLKGRETKSKVLSAAHKLVHAKGFGAVSVNDIIEATGVKKGNLYFHFSGKRELGLAILEEASGEFAAFVDKNLQGASPLQRISHFFDAVFEKHSRAGFIGG